MLVVPIGAYSRPVVGGDCIGSNTYDVDLFPDGVFVTRL